MNKQIQLSIVIPVYNSAKIFPELYRRIAASLKKVTSDYEIIAILDGCKDDSFEVISGFSKSDNRLKVLEFSRNFGHQAAISAGLHNASGEMVAVMDDDLEDPPEVLPQMISKVNEGYDVVYGIRKNRKRSFISRLLYNNFYRILNMLADIKMPYDAGDFCITRDYVVRVLNDLPERNMYLRGLRAWSGFKQTGIEYDRGARFANESGYSLGKYIALAADAMISFSYKPLRLVMYSGVILAFTSFAYGALLIYGKLTGRIPDVPGWTTLTVLILLFSGSQLISIGIMGEYIARIYDEVKQRPKYIIKRAIGLDQRAL